VAALRLSFKRRRESERVPPGSAAIFTFVPNTLAVQMGSRREAHLSWWISFRKDQSASISLLVSGNEPFITNPPTMEAVTTFYEKSRTPFIGFLHSEARRRDYRSPHRFRRQSKAKDTTAASFVFDALRKSA
jgi:hypothetical protein